MKDTYEISEGEFIVSEFSDHWIVKIKPFLLYIIAIALSIAIFYASTLLPQASVVNLIFRCAALGIFFVSNHWIVIFMLHSYVSTTILTNKRIISFKFIPFVKHDVEHLQIQEIKEINKIKHGIIQNVFNFGEVSINTVTSSNVSIFNNLPNPSKFVNYLQALRNSTDQTAEDLDELKKKLD